MKVQNRQISPLRYPGGKSRISTFLEDIILLNNIEDCTLYELYAGGAGASLNALMSGVCKKIVLNDLDIHIYSFWKALLEETERFIHLFESTSVDMNSWKVQKGIYASPESFSTLEIGFSTFFLNRCNRSGILQAGPIGGMNQTGNYKIDVRFNKPNLIRRIEWIASKKDSIEIHNKESIKFLKQIFRKHDESSFLFLDPPYYVQGENLYYSFYKDDDHLKLSKLLRDNQDANWFLTYDNSDRIKEIYEGCKTAYLPMNYTLQKKTKTKEIMVFSDKLYVPKQLKIGSKSDAIAMINI